VPFSWQPTKLKLKVLVPLALAAGMVVGVSWNDHVADVPASDQDQSLADAHSTDAHADRSTQAKSTQTSTIALTSTVQPPTDSLPPPEAVGPVAAVPLQSALTIKAVGDMILGTNFPNNRLPDQDGVWLFDSVKPFFDGADILFGNFESTLTDYPNTAKDISQGQTFAFRTPPFYANLLQQVGFDVLSVANNHSLDFGDQGFADTIAHIQQTGMQAVGQQHEIVYTTVKGVKVAFIGFSYFPEHNSLLDLDAARALVEVAKQQANIVVISVHAGAEGTDALHTRNETEYFFGENRGNLVEFSRAMVDQGADLILGHGPHVPRAMELYKSRLIAYSLGNFVGYRTLSTDGVLSYSLILDAQLSDQGEFVTGRIIPVRLNDQGVPLIDDTFKSVSFVRNLIESDFPVTPLLIDESGQILRNEAPLPAT
jgi:poly-gamma-glutamate synthesis protein (capsule biosynthesis protein)